MPIQTSLRLALLPAIDKLRGVPGQLDLRQYTVRIVTRTWSGSRVGLGQNTDINSGIKVDLGVYQTKVTQVTQRDVIASGGAYQEMDLKVGPITPPYTGSSADNDAITAFDPLPGASPAEVFFFISGPGMPNGAWFKKVGQNVTKNFRYDFIVRRTGEIP